MFYLTIGGIVSVAPNASTTSYIGYGSTGPLTINSTAGVIFRLYSFDNAAHDYGSQHKQYQYVTQFDATEFIEYSFAKALSG